MTEPLEGKYDALNNNMCAQKGLLFDKYTLLPKLLTETDVQRVLYGDRPSGVEWSKQLSRKRSARQIYRGVTQLYEQSDLAYYKWVQLPDGRVDIHLPEALAHQLVPEATRAALLNHMSEWVRGGDFSNYRITHINLLITPPYAATQQWHQDNGSLAPEDYYTVLIPLNQNPLFGHTQLVVPYKHKLPKTPHTVEPSVAPGDGLLFSGALWHRGTYNGACVPRYCLYLIVSRAPPESLVESWTS